MSKKPLVSVLVPVFNSQSYIEPCLKSILSQSYSNLEILVCDDCSTDKTREIVSKLAKADKRINLYKNSRNLGIAGNRNKLVKLAKGEFIAWQDADDISRPRRIEKQLSFMLNHPEVVIVGGWIQYFSVDGKTSIRKYPENDQDIRKKIFRYPPIAQPCALIRKSALEKAGQYDVFYPPAEDLDMSFKLGLVGKFANLQEVILDYRENFSGATFTKFKILEEKTISIRLKYSHNGYHMTTFDKIYNLLHYASHFLPVSAYHKLRLFKLIRNLNI